MKHKKSASPKKKKSNGPHIALHLPLDAPGLYTHCMASWAAIKADSAHFASLYPPAVQVDAELATLGAALQAAEGGDPIALTALGVAATKVRQTFGMVGKYVQSVVRAAPIEDAPAIISNVLMFVSNIGKRAPKPELQARHGATSGFVLLIALAVATAVLYDYEYSLDQLTWTLGAQVAQTRTSIAGLTPGKMYYFRVRAIKRDGTTQTSQIVSFMAT